MYLYTRMLEIGALSDSKLLCRFTVIFNNSIHRYDVVSNTVADNIIPLILSTYYSDGTHVLFKQNPRTIQTGPT